MAQFRNSISNQFSNKLIEWSGIYGRTFPWRRTNDPYQILIAEVMLHRTKASQVEAIFNAFVERYPNLETLSMAEMNEISDILRSLGLNWRTKLIIHMAKEINQAYDGKIPEGKKDLISLPGVGDYLSSAIRCFAFGYPEIVVDTNTSRVIARLYSFEEKGEMRRKKEVRDAYELILDNGRPREFNYALLDIGAIICTPRHKKCSICPVCDYCKTAKNEVMKLEKYL